jgi:hypothetical protein
MQVIPPGTDSPGVVGGGEGGRHMRDDIAVLQLADSFVGYVVFSHHEKRRVSGTLAMRWWMCHTRAGESVFLKHERSELISAQR